MRHVTELLGPDARIGVEADDDTRCALTFRMYIGPDPQKVARRGLIVVAGLRTHGGPLAEPALGDLGPDVASSLLDRSCHRDRPRDPGWRCPGFWSGLMWSGFGLGLVTGGGCGSVGMGCLAGGWFPVFVGGGV